MAKRADLSATKVFKWLETTSDQQLQTDQNRFKSHFVPPLLGFSLEAFFYFVNPCNTQLEICLKSLCIGVQCDIFLLCKLLITRFPEPITFTEMLPSIKETEQQRLSTCDCCRNAVLRPKEKTERTQLTSSKESCHPSLVITNCTFSVM